MSSEAVRLVGNILSLIGTAVFIAALINRRDDPDRDDKRRRALRLSYYTPRGQVLAVTAAAFFGTGWVINLVVVVGG